MYRTLPGPAINIVRRLALAERQNPGISGRMSDNPPTKNAQPAPESGADEGLVETKTSKKSAKGKADEIGGPKGLEPTRYGDWERDGRCIDF